MRPDDGVVERLGRCECFGDEDLLSASRRAHRAEAGQEASCLLLRVPQELYRKYLAHLHIPDFEDKVGRGTGGRDEKRGWVTCQQAWRPGRWWRGGGGKAYTV